ncbi:MAG: amidohydrolase [Bacteroidales bacterium]|jgi:hippurate hydrolase|nr:amidohydrolase [Bacteroidales bacterium]
MINSIKDSILAKSAELYPEIVRLRRHFHRYPELSYRETETSKFICRWLADNGIPFRNNIAGTGIVAEVAGEKGGGCTVAVRAEMDALPVTETNAVRYASVNSGIMHACGHDAHMAMAMGAAIVIKSIAGSTGGKALFIFQPGEEKSPGGAKMMIDAGAFGNTKPDIIIATHNLPGLKAGEAGYCAGSYLASCDEIYITLTGKGGHAAIPHLTTDQIYIASKLVTLLREKMASHVKANNQPTVLGIGKISGEGATNIIPDKVEIAGTFRTFDNNWRREGIELIKEIASECAAEHRVAINVSIEAGYPVLVNDEQLACRAVKLSEQLLGKENVRILDTRMASDDFSFYSALAPTLYYRTGMEQTTAGGELRKLHTSEFDIDENGMETGVANMSWLMFNFMSRIISFNKS